MKRHRKRHRVNAAQLALTSAVVDEEPDVQRTPPEMLEAAVADIDRMLIDLCIDAPLVAALTDSHQEGLGFLTPEGQRAQDEQQRKDRRAQFERLQAGHTVGPGASPAPGNIAGLSVDADLWAVLSTGVRTVLKHLASHGETHAPLKARRDAVRGAANDTDDLARYLRELVWRFNDADRDLKIATDLERTITRVHDAVDRLVEGTDLARSSVPCPHCGRKSLLIAQRAGVVRCDRDPRTKNTFRPCECDQDHCQCHTTPITFRHVWVRNLGGQPGNSWDDLKAAFARAAKRSEAAAAKAKTTAKEPDTSVDKEVPRQDETAGHEGESPSPEVDTSADTKWGIS